jgi:hypothetical protein
MIPPRMLDREITDRRAWRRSTLRDADWLVPIAPQAMDELRGAVLRMRERPMPTETLSPSDFPLPACAVMMAGVRGILREGAGFAVVDRLPMDEISADEAIALYWLLSSMIARPVHQKIDGTMIYDVLDTGKKALPGSGVRPDKTNIEQNFHNDNAYSLVQPEHVGLLCIHPAKEGGVSAVINLHTVHNEMRARHPALLQRLYGQFWVDRQKEHVPEDPPLLRVPMFEYDGRLKVRMGIYNIIAGHQLRGEPLDAPGIEAIDALRSVFRDETLSHSFTMERGQMEFVNNLETCHRRTAFVDFDEVSLRRRMVRLWLRDAGGLGYDG